MRHPLQCCGGEATGVRETSGAELKITASAMLARGGPSCVIGLEEIRRVAGPRWDKMRESIYSRIEAILRQKLGPSDFFIQIDDVSYLVTIPAVEPEEAQICCLRVAHELHTGLLGPCSIGQLRIAVATAASDTALALSPIVAPQILTLAERAGIDELVGGAPNGAARTRRAALAAAPSSQCELVHRFVPIWDARAEAISAYRCIVEPIEPEADVKTPADRARAALRVALEALDRSVAALETGASRSERFLIHLKVSFETLTSPVARMEFVSACRGLSHELRPYLVFEIGELPVGVPQSRLNELVTTIKAFGRGVTAEAALRNPTLTMYQGIGLQAIGLNLARQQDSLTRIEIERLAASAKRFGMLAFLSEIPNAALVEFARGQGVQWLSGPAIAKALPEPGPMFRLSSESILRRQRRVS
jgi:hypothetical protein